MAAQDGSLRLLVGADTVLRTLLRNSELVDPRSAFFIRTSERNTGLSVNFDMTPEECRAQTCFNKTYGVRSLLVQLVRELNLEIVPDAAHHANVIGIPHSDDDPVKAEFLAGQLLKISDLVSQGLVKNPQHVE
jgi:hypothetical protein